MSIEGNKHCNAVNGQNALSQQSRESLRHWYVRLQPVCDSKVIRDNRLFVQQFNCEISVTKRLGMQFLTKFIKTSILTH